MKKTAVLYIMSMISFVLTLKAQTDTTITLDNFSMPTTPAASILNMGTQSITRPTTPKGVATSLLSGFGGGGTLNPNINIEFAPYWLKSHRKLSFADYYQLHDTKDASANDVGQNMLRSLAISVATSKLGDNKDTLKGTRLSIGIRTQLLSGKIAPQTKQEIRAIDLKFKSYDIIKAGLTVLRVRRNKEYLGLLNDSSSYSLSFQQILLTTVEELLKASVDINDTERKQVLEMTTTQLNEVGTSVSNMSGKEALKKLEDQIEKKKEYALQLQKIRESDKNKVGFFCELAFAGIQYLNENSFDQSVFQKAGIWTTLTYRSENQKSEFAFLGRHLFTNNDSASTNTDFGISATRIVDKGFNYGLELIFRNYSYRYNTKDFLGNDIRAIRSGSTYRLNLSMEYKLSEIVSFTASVGKDFNGPFTTSNNFLSIVGANFSLPALITLTR